MTASPIAVPAADLSHQPVADARPAPPVLRSDGTAFFAGCATLVVSDVHLEKGSAFARRGALLPPFDTGETLRRLETALAATGARRLISLGDSFHDVQAGRRMAPADRDRLLGLLNGIEAVWVEGNHDPELPGWLQGQRVESLVVAGWTLRHEPSAAADPTPEIAGHLHPCAKVAGASGRRVRRPCFAVGPTRIIMPAFGAYTGGLNLRDPAFAAHFASPPVAHIPGRERVHRVSFTRLLPDGPS
jgi:uncharacterized protein